MNLKMIFSVVATLFILVSSVSASECDDISEENKKFTQKIVVEQKDNQICSYAANGATFGGAAGFMGTGILGTVSGFFGLPAYLLFLKYYPSDPISLSAYTVTGAVGGCILGVAAGVPMGIGGGVAGGLIGGGIGCVSEYCSQG